MRLGLLLLALLGATAASGQSLEAVTSDGRRVVLIESGIWVDADSAWTGLRGGERIESETGRFAVHVPERWRVEPPTGEMLQGEFLLIRDDSVYVSPAFVEVPDPSRIVPLAFSTLTQIITEMGGGVGEEQAEGVTIRPLERRWLDGHILFSQTITYLDAPGASLQISTLVTPTGFVLVIGLSPTLGGGDAMGEMIRRVEVVDTQER